VVFIEGQGLLVEAGYAYVVKDKGISGDVEGRRTRKLQPESGIGRGTGC